MTDDLFLQTLLPTTHDLGGFKVHRTLPHRERTTIGPFIFFDQMGPAQARAGRGHRRPAASAHQPRHRHLSVRRRDRPSQFARHLRDDRAGRGQSDDRRARHRPFGALAGGAARRRARSSPASRPGSRCRPRRRRSTRRSSMSPRRSADRRGRRRPRARGDGHAVGRDLAGHLPQPDHLCRHPPRAGGAMPIDPEAEERGLYVAEGEASARRRRRSSRATLYVLRPGIRARLCARGAAATSCSAAARRSTGRATSGGTSSRRAATGSTRPRRTGKPAASRCRPTTMTNSSRCPKCRRR